MNLTTLLVIILVLAIAGSLPYYPHSANYGYFPSGGLGALLLVILVLWLLKVI